MDAMERMLILLGDVPQDICQLLLDTAADEIKSFCSIDEVPKSLIGLQVELAIRKYNRMGTEGETGRGQGGISRSFTGEGLTNDDKLRLYPYRRMVL